MTIDWPALAERLKTAAGPDPSVDTAIAEVFGVPSEPYTGSVEHCRRLVAKVLPGWRLHLGFDGSGVLPYASLSNAENRAEATAPTVPLAILRAMMGLASVSMDKAVPGQG
jgi:hypothetical protein